jgi:hypothetical protein
MADLRHLRLAAEREYPDLVESTEIVRDKLRVVLRDGSYIDFWWSVALPGRYAHHWERRHVDGTIFRHDNIPHLKWAKLSTFPQHFHRSHPDNVMESVLSEEPEAGLRQFLDFARTVVRSC